MGGSSSSSDTSNKTNSDNTSVAPTAQGDGNKQYASNIGGIATGKNSTVNLTITDAGAVAAGVDLAEKVSLAAIAGAQAVAGDSMTFANAMNTKSLDFAEDVNQRAMEFAARNATLTESATREAMKTVAGAVQGDGAQALDTLQTAVKVAGAVAVVVVVVWLWKGGSK